MQPLLQQRGQHCNPRITCRIAYRYMVEGVNHTLLTWQRICGHLQDWNTWKLFSFKRFSEGIKWNSDKIGRAEIVGGIYQYREVGLQAPPAWHKQQIYVSHQLVLLKSIRSIQPPCSAQFPLISRAYVLKNSITIGTSKVCIKFGNWGMAVADRYSRTLL